MADVIPELNFVPQVKIERKDISFADPKDHGAFEDLIQCIRDAHAPIHIDLGNVSCTQEQWHTLFKKMQASGSVRALALTGCALFKFSLMQVITDLLVNTKLNSLNLNGNGYSAKDGLMFDYIITEGVLKSTSLMAFTFQNNSVQGSSLYRSTLFSGIDSVNLLKMQTKLSLNKGGDSERLSAKDDSTFGLFLGSR